MIRRLLATRSRACGLSSTTASSRRLPACFWQAGQARDQPNHRFYATTADMSLPNTFPMKVQGGKTIPMPTVGFGTWASGGPNMPASGEWVKKAVLDALRAGYRHLDCAWYYGVDREIGEAIRDSGVPRKEIFITSKAWNNFLAPEALSLCLDKTLEDMQLSYVDLYLLHWPVAFQATSLQGLRDARAEGSRSLAEKGLATNDKGSEVIDWRYTSAPIAKAAGHPEGTIVPTWQAMTSLVESGKALAVGVSNFGIQDIQDLLPHAKEIPISCNQIEVHPWLPNSEVIDFANAHGILTSCFSPFAGQKKDGATLIKDETVQKLAKKNDMDVGQLLQSWAVQRGTVPLGKSQNSQRIKSNLDIRRLSDDDFETLNALAIPNFGGRTIDFTDEWGVKLYMN